MNGSKKSQSITFRVDEAEVRRLVNFNLTKRQADKILSMVENDPVLWSAIDKSIQDAADFEIKNGNSVRNPSPPRVNASEGAAPLRQGSAGHSADFIDFLDKEKRPAKVALDAFRVFSAG